MKITSVSIQNIQGCKRLLVNVNIVIDNNILIKNIRLFKNDNRIFIEFPSSSKNSRYPDIIPLNKTVREQIENRIISVYNRNIE